MPHDSLPTSLLTRLQDNQPSAWERLDDLYGPLILEWCRRRGVTGADAEDVRQETLVAAARGMPGFRRDRPGDTFRGWMATIARNKVNDHHRRQGDQPALGRGGSTPNAALQQHAEAVDNGSESDVERDAADRQALIRRAAELVKGDVQPLTWEAFWLQTVERVSAAEVAERLQMERAAVYQAKSRMLKRVREELECID